MVQRDLTVNIDGDPSGFDRASDDVVTRSLAMERQIAALERRLQSYEGQLKKTSETQKKQAETATKAGQGMQGGLASLITVGVAAGAAVTGAGVAFSLFAAVAIPSIKRVWDSQKNLNVSFETMNGNQRTTSVLVQQLAGDYQQLANSYEPKTLAAFNGLLLTARGIMPELNNVLAGTTVGVQGFVGKIEGFVQGQDMTNFLGWAGRTAPSALNTLGTTAATTGSLATTLIQQVAPLGLTTLQAANGALGMANALAKSNPELAQLAITTLAVRAPITGAVSGLANMTGKLAQAGGGTSALAKGARALNGALGASPLLYVAAGSALAFFALKAFSAKSSTDGLIDSLRLATGASGNNVAGYKALGAVLHNELNKSTAELDQIQVKAGGSGGKLAGIQNGQGLAAVRLTSAQKQLQAAIDDNDKSMRNITEGSKTLAGQMSITAVQARQLADAAGVDLSKSVDKSGKLSEAAAAKIRNYSAAVQLAKNPTERLKADWDLANNSSLLLKDRIVGVTDALDAYYNPSIAAYKATIALKDGYGTLLPQLAKLKGNLTGNTAASRSLQTAFAGQLDTVANLYATTFNQTKSTAAASAAVKAQLPLLYALAGNNKTARQQVDALAKSTYNTVGPTRISHDAFLAQAKAMGIAKGRAEDLWKQLQKLKDPITGQATLYANGSWRTTVEGRFPGISKAKGGHIPATHPGASRAYDSVPAMLRVDEHVLTPEEVDAMGGHGAVYRLRKAALRGEVKGYATGGKVSLTGDSRSNATVESAVTHPIASGITDLMNSISSVMAQAWKKFAQSGGAVVAAARSQIGLPYSWGGGGTGGPSYGIGRGAGTYGFDCSGLSEYAWYQGRHVDIGGSTGPQAANSSAIGGPRPGALGFVGSPIHHVMVGSDRPGYVIQAPHTGAYVEEVQRGSSNWRWPNAAGYASGGAVRGDATVLGEAFTRGKVSLSEAALARMLQIAGGAGRRGEDHSAQIADASQVRVWAEPETQGEAYIPLAASKRSRSTEILSSVARSFGLKVTRMADGGILSYADGGTTSDLNLSSILSDYTGGLNAASKADVTAAAKSRTSEIRKLKDAEDALARARKAHHKDWAKIREDERHVKQDRADLAAATRKLADTEARYRAGQQSPATQLGSALGLNIRNTGAFIANLTKLNARGYGTLAQQLLAMGGTDAEKIAADAVKFSNAKLKALQNQVGTAQSQATQLSNLGNTLAVSNALKGGKYTTFAALQTATGLDATTLAAVIRGMQSTLAKTTAGKALLADMKTYGFARGGMVLGPGGVDQVPIMATAGEWITPASQVGPNMAVLQAIRSGARLGDTYLTGGHRTPPAATSVHKTNNILPGATIQLSEKADVDLLAQQLDWQARTASFGGN
jgi:cell wall-associated NlpC family hydrolase